MCPSPCTAAPRSAWAAAMSSPPPWPAAPSTGCWLSSPPACRHPRCSPTWMRPPISRPRPPSTRTCCAHWEAGIPNNWPPCSPTTCRRPPSICGPSLPMCCMPRNGPGRWRPWCRGRGPRWRRCASTSSTLIRWRQSSTPPRSAARCSSPPDPPRAPGCSRPPPDPASKATSACPYPEGVAHLLGAEALHLEYPTRVVLDTVTLGVNEGDRIGIVGRNGDGKSSLLGLLAKRLSPDGGRVTWRGGLRFGVLTQRDELDSTDTVERAIVGEQAEHEWASDARIRDIITGLAADVPWHAKISDLSGGQRRRVALAALLVGEWDVLALDEPTNHLDLDGVAWLARHLGQRWADEDGALLVITHDRWFLDEVCTTTWEVHNRTVDAYEGGYAAYVLQRVERDRQAAASEAKRQNLLRKELAWLRRGAPARTSKPKFRIEAANQLIADVPPLRDRLELSRLATARLGKDVVDLLDVSVSFGENAVLRDIEWRIAPGERTGILGANGAGKSTLLALVAGTLRPDAGRVKHGKTVRVAMLDQQFSQLADIAGDRVRDVLARTRASYVVDGKELTPAQLLERLGFSRAHLSARVGELSGGQKRRLQLLLIQIGRASCRER